MTDRLRSRSFSAALSAIALGALASVALCVGLIVAASPALANSDFSAGGLGEPSLAENARIRALGGAGVAESGPSSFSMVNPASIAEARFLSLEATMMASRRSVATLHYGNESAHEASFPSVRLVIRLPQGIILGGSYLVGTNSQFEISRAESSGTASVLNIEGTGGINYARATLARSFSRQMRLGVDYEIIGGSYREQWVRTFAIPTLSPSRDTLETTWDRLGRWRFGAQYGGERFAIGGVYETGRRLPITMKQRTAGSSVESKSTLTIPAGFAAGFRVAIGARGRVVGQYRRQDWNDESLESDLVDFRAEERYSIGFEKEALGVGSVLNKLPLRIGATYLRWPDLLPVAGADDVSGGTAELDEWAVSIGTGVRTPDRGGTIDVSLEGGSRGDLDQLGLRETFFRAAVSIRVSDETWK